MHTTLIEVPRMAFPLNHASNVVVAPLGIAYIAASIEAAGHQVEVIDSIGEGMTEYTPFGPVYLRGLQFDEVVRRIDPRTDVIGVSNMFSCGWLATRQLLHKIRKEHPTKPIIFGGEHPTGMPDLTMQQSPVDYICMGEGEETIVELLDHISGGHTPASSIAGICYRSGDNAIATPRRARIRDIDAIPEPAWNHFRIDDYIELGQPHGAVKGRYMPMLATRGCPYKCSFCTSPQMWGQKWVARDYRKVVDEMEKYIGRYNVTDFHFEDLTAIVRRDWILNFAGEIQRRGLKVTYQLPSGTRSEAIDKEVATALKESGCSDFPFAPESGDVRILKAIHKAVKLDSLFTAAKQAIEGGINVTCNFIFGFPEDDWLSLFNMYKAILRCALGGFSGVNINAYSPQPNTESFNALRNAGKIPQLDDKYFLSLFTFQSFFVKKTSYNDRFSSWQITLFILFGFLLFHIVSFTMRPKKAYHLVHSLFANDTEDKQTSYARSMLWELQRIWTFRRRLKKGDFSFGSDVYDMPVSSLQSLEKAVKASQPPTTLLSADKLVNFPERSVSNARSADEVANVPARPGI